MRIIVPLSLPAIGTTALFTFINTWNDFLGPLLYLSKSERWTVAARAERVPRRHWRDFLVRVAVRHGHAVAGPARRVLRRLPEAARRGHRHLRNQVTNERPDHEAFQGCGPLAVAGVVASVLLSACSNDSATSTGEGTPTGTLQLTYWGSSSRVDKYNKIDALFQQKYPGTTVQASSTDFASYFDKLNVQAASRSMPCVTTMQTRQLNDYTSNGTMADLDPLVTPARSTSARSPRTSSTPVEDRTGSSTWCPSGWPGTRSRSTRRWPKNTASDAARGLHLGPVRSLAEGLGRQAAEGVEVSDDQGMDEPPFSAYVISNGYTMFGQDREDRVPEVGARRVLDEVAEVVEGRLHVDAAAERRRAGSAGAVRRHPQQGDE